MPDTLTPKSHIAWVDLLRIMACLAVLVSHSCDPFVAQAGNNPGEYLAGVSWGSLVRWCVPLFVMISGVLLLPVKQDMGTFYKRRLKRILLPLVFWSLLLPVLFYGYLAVVPSASPCIDPADHTGAATLKKLYTFVFNFNYDTIPFWYLYMLLGLYLLMPILGAWLVQTSKRDIERVLALWGVSLFIPYIQLAAPGLGYGGNGGNGGLLGVCDWNAFGTFYYFSGFAGYLVLARYLVRYPLNWDWRLTWVASGVCFAAGYAATLYGFLLTYEITGQFAYCEVVWGFCSPNVLLMTLGVFLPVQKMKLSPSPHLSEVAALTFGIYLCHFIVVQMGYDLIHPNVPVSAWLQIPLIALGSFLVSAGVIWSMRLSKMLRNVTG